MNAPDVRKSFLEQAEWCRKLGSPFTAHLCETLAGHLDADGEIGREILDWPGNPAATADALALRVAGALHSLVRAEAEPGLARLYPPAPLPAPEELWSACRSAFARNRAHFRQYLAAPPQTNEVGRSAVLMPGFLELARRHDVPLHLFEIGASAGLNLIPDRYRYRFGGATWGDPQAGLELTPTWTGSPPAVDAGLSIASRQGSDLAPIDVRSTAERTRLLSYVWADQPDRLQRLDAAIRSLLAAPVAIEKMDAADWVESRIPPEAANRDGCRVLFHSLVWSYLPPATRERIAARVAACGAAASHARPFAWLRFEFDGSGSRTELVMSSWPGGETATLAISQPHGRSINYLL
jgi:hypothetical protein